MQLGALLEVDGIKCELSDRPLGIQSTHPHLSWVLESRDQAYRGLRQIAYQILVATSSELLSRELGDSWDTGKVDSSQHIHVIYNGAELSSHHTYYWKVRVWDQNGTASQWSELSTWTTGILHPEEWTAKWIAAQPDGGTDVATGDRPDRPLPMFRREFDLVGSAKKAIVYVSGLGQYELRINGQKVSDDVLSPAWSDYRRSVLYNTYDVTKLVHKGRNAIGVMLGNGMYTSRQIRADTLSSGLRWDSQS